MESRLLETRAHTTSKGILQLDLDLGIPNADVTVTVQLAPLASTNVDANGWPIGFFETVAGSLPSLERQPQGDFEQRMPLS